MDFGSINNCMSDQQKLSLSAASLSALTGGGLTYDDINNKMNDHEKLSLIASALTQLGGGSNVLRGRIALDLSSVSYAELADYAPPLGMPNEGLMVKQRELQVTLDGEGSAASFIGQDGEIVPWEDVISAIEKGEKVEITSIDHLGGKPIISEDGTSVTFEPDSSTFKQMLGTSTATTPVSGSEEVTSAVSISALGFIGSDFASANFGGSFYAFCIDIDYKREETGEISNPTILFIGLSVTELL